MLEKTNEKYNSVMASNIFVHRANHQPVITTKLWTYCCMLFCT